MLYEVITEFALLQVLARHPRRPLGRDRLIELSRGRDHEASDRSIDVQVIVITSYSIHYTKLYESRQAAGFAAV